MVNPERLYPLLAVLAVTLAFSMPLHAGMDTQSHSQADLVWRHSTSGQNSLWHMSAANRSSRESLPGVADPSWHIEGMADFDGDGDQDILFRHQTRGENRVWVMRGGTRESSTAITGAHPDWSLISIADFDGDGDPDLIWRNSSTGANRFWEMNGLSRVRSVAVQSVAPGPWVMVGSADMNADGMADLVWRNPDTASTRVWLMDAETRSSAGTLPAVGGAWTIAGVADFDADGMADLFWHNPETGANTIWLMSGVNRLSRASIPTTDLAWQPAGVADLDADGKADIVWRNNTNGQNRLWIMDGSLRRSSIAIMGVADQGWEIVGVGDVDGPATSGGHQGHQGNQDPDFIIRDFAIPLPLFAADSAWNQSAASAQVLADSEQIMLTTYRVTKGDVSDQVPSGVVTPFDWPYLIVNYQDWTIPIFRSSGVSSVLLCDYEGAKSWPNGHFPAATNDLPGGPVDLGTPVGRIRPSDPAGDFSDGHLVLFDPITLIEYDIWQATTSRNGECQSQGGGLAGTSIIEAGAVDRFDITGTGVNDAGFFSARASGVPLLAGLLLPEDVASGSIDHALSLAIPGPRNLSPDPEEIANSEFTYPATVTETDFFSIHANAMIMGQRVRLKQTLVDDDGLAINESEYAPVTRMLLTALREYGAYLVDNSGGFLIYAEDTHSGFLNVTDDQVNELIGAPQGTDLTSGKSRWQIVMEQLAADLDANPIAIATGPFADGQDPATATADFYNFEMVDNAIDPSP